MEILNLILVLLLSFLITGAVSKLVMYLFSRHILAYSSSLVLIVLSTSAFYLSVLFIGTIIALEVHFILGIVVGIFLLIGTVGVGFKDVLRDAHRSLDITRTRRQ